MTEGDWVTKKRVIWSPRAVQLLRERASAKYAQAVVHRFVKGVRIRFAESKVHIGLRVVARSKRIEGRSLMRMAYEQDMQALALDMAMVALEALESAAVVSDPFRLFRVMYGWVRRMKPTVSELYGESILSPKQRGKLNRLLANITQNSGINRRVLVHGDLHAGNILVNCEERSLGFIDLEMLHIGKSATNFAQLWISFHLADESLGKLFYQRYISQFGMLWDEPFDVDVRAEIALRSYALARLGKRAGNTELEEKARLLLDRVLDSRDFRECLFARFLGGSGHFSRMEDL